MAKNFELKLSRGDTYDERVDVEIRFKTPPTSEDYKDMLKAISVLNTYASKYLTIKPSPTIVKKGEIK